jgi:hypothetical protein
MIICSICLINIGTEVMKKKSPNQKIPITLKNAKMDLVANGSRKVGVILSIIMNRGKVSRAEEISRIPDSSIIQESNSS